MSATHRWSTEPTRSPATPTPPPTGPAGFLGFALALTRISLGFVFLWAFLDKALGLGFSTASDQAWIHGGSPTEGFLSHVGVGPFQSQFQSIAGDWWADWLFMLGLLGIGVALILGIAIRPAAVAAVLMLALMWLAEFPPDRFTATGDPSGSTNPIIDYHFVYAATALALAATHAGDFWGLGRAWRMLPPVRRSPWLH